MRSDISNGIAAGLLGGVVFGIMMQMMNAPTPDGGCECHLCGWLRSEAWSATWSTA